MSVLTQDIITIANKIIDDKSSFSEQEKLNEEGVETILYTKTYNSKNLPEGLTEGQLKSNGLFGDEIVKVEGTVDLSIDDLIAVFKKPETKKHSNPKVVASVMLEDKGDTFITYAYMNSGSAFVSARSNLLENKIIKESDGKVLILSKSIPEHPQLATVIDEKKNSIVRATYHLQGVRFESVDANKTKYSMFVSVSLEGSIPSFVAKVFLRKTPLEIPKGWKVQQKHL